jgi:hypothetical protein
MSQPGVRGDRITAVGGSGRGLLGVAAQNFPNSSVSLGSGLIACRKRVQLVDR